MGVSHFPPPPSFAACEGHGAGWDSGLAIEDGGAPVCYSPRDRFVRLLLCSCPFFPKPAFLAPALTLT